VLSVKKNLWPSVVKKPPNHPHSTLNLHWHKIAESAAEIPFAENGMTEIEVNGKTICIGLSAGRIFACTHKCPHAGGALSEGYIDVQGNLVCPLHRYRFDLKNGRNISGEGYFLKTFPVEQREEGIFIALP